MKFLCSLLLALLSISLTASATPLPPSFSRNFIDKLLPRKPVDVSRLGISAFVNDSRFGSIGAQLNEVKNTLKIKYIRVLFNWDDNVQPTPLSSPNFSFYDDIVKNLPDGVEAFAVLTGLPSWMKESRNWIDGDPRKTFVTQWVKPIAQRYIDQPRLIGFQIWNEQNAVANPDNTTLVLTSSPKNYVEMLAAARKEVKAARSSYRVINAATTAINQNYPRSLQYNKEMKNLGMESITDVWALHYYGKNIENVLRPGGIKSFTRNFKKSIWLTESGAQGVNQQREYAERYWSFLRSNIKKLTRIYLYQFTEDTVPEKTYGLRNPSTSAPVSDLYVWLRDRSS